MNSRPLSIPVILGTTRKGRMSAHAARFMVGQIKGRDGVTTELIDISELPMPIDDAGDGIKDPAFSEKMAMAEGVVIVTPGYNHNSYRAGCIRQACSPTDFSSDAIA